MTDELRTAATIARHVWRHHTPGPCTRRCIWHAISSRDRRLGLPLETLIATAELHDWIKPNTTHAGFVPGAISPPVPHTHRAWYTPGPVTPPAR
jgi:hypothetical protein